MNDTYRTDLCLLYPPFMIALGKTKLSTLIPTGLCLQASRKFEVLDLNSCITNCHILVSGLTDAVSFLLQPACMWHVWYSRKMPGSGLLSCQLTWRR